MPTTNPGRELIQGYIKKNNIRISDLAKLYGMKQQDVNDYVYGKKVNPASNKFILKLIRDFKVN